MEFEEIVRLNYHLLPQFAIGGTMKDTIAANAPKLLLLGQTVE